MVVVVAPESEYVMFNEMLSSGRNMAEPFRISVNFTVATGVTPDVKMANTNCQNGRVLATNYALDRTGQDQLDELESVRNSITIYTELIEFTKHVRDSQALVSIDPATGKATLLPDPPPPPPPPPPTPAGPDGSPAPPAPPATVSLDRQVQIYEAEKLAFEEREAALVDALETCVVGDRASGTVCGLTSNEARTHARTHALPFRAPAVSVVWPCVCVCVAGARPVGRPRRRALPRLRHAASAREGLLRLLVRDPGNRPLVVQPTDAHPASSVAGTLTSTRSRPTPTCASSSSRRAPFASTRRAASRRARPTPRARSARASTTWPTWRARTAVSARRSLRASASRPRRPPRSRPSSSAAPT